MRLAETEAFHYIQENGYQIFETEGNEAFSFLNIIFIGKQISL